MTPITGEESEMGKTRAQRRAEKRKAVDRLERVGPTPETLAKLRPDPFNLLVERGVLDTAERDAGLEIRALWYAITAGMMPSRRDMGASVGRGEMTDALAEIHARVYRPWCEDWGRAVADVLDLVVDALMPANIGQVQLMLRDYARRRRIFVVSQRSRMT